MMAPLLPKTRRSRIVLLAILVGWLWPFPYFNTLRSDGTINNPNEVTRVYAVAALVDDGSWSIDAPIKRWGGVDDKAQRDAKMYSSKAPGTTLVGAPVYGLYRVFGAALSKRELTWFLRVVVGFPFSLFLLLLLRRELARSGDEDLADGVLLCVGLGSMIYPYTLLFAGHGMAAACVFAAYIYGRSNSRQSMLLFGFFAALAPAMEYPHALAILPLGLRFLLAEGRQTRALLRRAAHALAAGSLPIAATCYAQSAMFGGFSKTGYSFLENNAYKDLHGGGFFGISLPHFERLGTAFFSLELGMFFFTPLLLLGAIGLINKRNIALRGERGWILALIGLELLFLAGHDGWRGGWSLGPRYILPVVPFLFLGLTASFRPALLGAFAGVSILVCGLPSALYPHLSDLFSNPWASFVLPAIKSGLAPYQPGAFAEGASWGPGIILGGLSIAAFSSARLLGGRAGLSLMFPLLLIYSLVVRSIPERDPNAARSETCRLYKLWEPRVKRPVGDLAVAQFNAERCRAQGLIKAIQTAEEKP
jgi:hypothetical protein